ncbi:hypothetical protein BC332_20690 [Capsicum chinense]|nr:hypothetical protein BC332_20690 [Capsicum chinense]
MDEEFQETDMLFGQDNDEVVQKSADEDSNDEADQQSADEEESKEYGLQIRRNNNNIFTIREVTMKQNFNSILVKLAENASWFKYDHDDDVEMMPPDVLIRWRIARRMMAFSVSVGWRDLF